MSFCFVFSTLQRYSDTFLESAKRRNLLVVITLFIVVIQQPVVAYTEIQILDQNNINALYEVDKMERLKIPEVV